MLWLPISNIVIITRESKQIKTQFHVCILISLSIWFADPIIRQYSQNHFTPKLKKDILATWNWSLLGAKGLFENIPIDYQENECAGTESADNGRSFLNSSTHNSGQFLIPLQPTRKCYVAQYKELGFSYLFGLKMIILSTLTNPKMLGGCTFWA